MATGDIITKDLGLVTAYGYALAGGYEGTEAQFKEDFAALMSGQYTALGNKPSINGVTLTGNKTSADLGISGGADLEYFYQSDITKEPFVPDSNFATLSSMYVYGNISSLSLTLTAKKAITISAGETSAAITARLSDGRISAADLCKYCPAEKLTGTRGGTTSYSYAEVVGLASNLNPDIGEYLTPYTYCNHTISSGELTELWMWYRLENISSESYTIPSGTVIVIDNFFLNRAGMYDEYISE